MCYLNLTMTIPQRCPCQVGRQRASENEHRTQPDPGLDPGPQVCQLVESLCLNPTSVRPAQGPRTPEGGQRFTAFRGFAELPHEQLLGFVAHPRSQLSVLFPDSTLR